MIKHYNKIIKEILQSCLLQDDEATQLNVIQRAMPEESHFNVIK